MVTLTRPRLYYPCLSGWTAWATATVDATMPEILGRLKRALEARATKPEEGESVGETGK